jgi:NADH-quinone oxidoreductase subunit N
MEQHLLDINYHSILPEIITAGAGIAIMLFDTISDRFERKAAGIFSLVSIALSALAVLSLWSSPGKPSFSGMIVNDELRLFFSGIFLIVTFLIVLISLHWVKDEGLPGGEYYSLLMFATTGMLLMSSANDLVMIFLGLEITSISTYVLCGYRRRDPRSNESAVKYFILGSFSTAFLLYGIALIYGATYSPDLNPVVTTNLQLLKDRIASGRLFSSGMLMAGAGMLTVGFGFKIATAPFHVWSPDVYEGAPTPVTAFLSTGSKAAAFSAFARVFILAFAAASVVPAARLNIAPVQVVWINAIVIMAALSMTIGNLAALTQINIKRMLAYSSIAHAGYALVGMAALDWRSVAFYLLSYVIINIGALAVIEIVARRGDRQTLLADYSGIGFKSPALSAVLSLFMLSLAGIPLTAGFMGKLLVFKSAWLAGLHWLVVVAVINSAVSWYYYLRVVVLMYFAKPAESYDPPGVAGSMKAALVLAVLGTLYLGILPGRVLKGLERAGIQNIAVRK